MEVGYIVCGGDGWADANLTSINNIMLFTPIPLYIETALCPEQRQTSSSTAEF